MHTLVCVKQVPDEGYLLSDRAFSGSDTLAIRYKSIVKEVLFIGQDQGTRTDLDGVFNYARSLTIEKALHEDTIIAYELNESIIPYEHGFSLRLVVPEWYGMASVKWLKEI